MRFINVFRIVLSSLLIAALGACAAGGARRDAGAYFDDVMIGNKVKAALAADPALATTQIHIDTYQGVVQLSGFVASPDDVPKALALARKVGGVQSVKNDIAVQR